MSKNIDSRLENWIKGLNYELFGVRFAALFTAFMGIINLSSAIQPALQVRFAVIEKIFPLEVLQGSRMTSALAGFGLLLLSNGLWRRKRTTWILTIILLTVSIITHLIKGLDVEEASVSLVLLLLLVFLRHSFHASSDRPSWIQGLQVLGIAFGFTLVYGTMGFFLLDKHFSAQFNLVDALRQTVVMFTSFYNPGLEPLSRFGRYFADSIYVIGFSTLGFALLMLLRPVLVRSPATPHERERAGEIVTKYGRTSLARAVLFDDKSYFFGPGDTVIGYAAAGRGVIALGDPIGPPEQIGAAIKAFKDFCVRNDWIPSFVSTLPDYLELYKTNGFDTICIGYEAIVASDKFNLEGSDNKGIRNNLSRMDRMGFKAVVHQPPIPDELLQKLHEISDAWLTFHHGGEMHFSDGWFNADYIRNGAVIVIYTSEGSPTAFANLVTEYQNNELTVDLMRHYRETERGTMEFLFVKMLQYAKEKGYSTFSLGLSAIMGVGEKPDDPRVEKALHTIADYVSRFYNFKGLHNFKEKFHPLWQPRYMIYPDAASLPLILNSMLRVHSGGNYLWKFLAKQK